MLNILHQVPDRFLDARPDELYELLGGPTLMHLTGRRTPTLFVSVLLHGNELTGLEAVQAVLRKYQDRELPRALSVFVGNVEAAKYGLRRLDDQPDYNRVWPGCKRPVGSAEEEVMARVVEEMRRRGTFASVDIHNNSGLNPHYGCVNRLDHRFFNLATMFSRTVVYFTQPCGVQSAAFAPLCPAVTVECGQSGQAHSTEHAIEFVDACLHLAEIPEHPVPEHDINLFHTVATVQVPNEYSLSFSDRDTDILLEPDLDHLNFRELEPGAPFGQIRPGSDVRLRVWDNEGNEVGERFFSYDHNQIVLKRSVMPSMLTRDERAIRQDCLCYLMERYPLATVEPGTGDAKHGG